MPARNWTKYFPHFFVLIQNILQKDHNEINHNP